MSNGPWHTSEIITRPIATPVGTMIAMATPHGLCALEFNQEERLALWKLRSRRWFPEAHARTGNTHHIDAAERWIESYFTKQWNHLPTIPLDQRGSTFELQVWSAISSIPAGETVAYGELAIKLGRSSAARAVGNATRRNPIALIVPCHRVVGARASLTGYSGGLSNKEQLLLHESCCASVTD